ncbi:polyhydroxyalkanoic acid system family protein [Sphingomonas sp. ATCC 31555]|uniref:polyhydroxyalkanoic acid system family protein n=1 Tax=Sphingomonas sp. ATCC 31555 TaxID=194867 RepID=UPI00031F1DFF|nr:polyhydroxyalkanoic acid system family protein [Sphingomonas sp. ATCC 31555]
MTPQPTQADIPHQLTRADARTRIDSKIGRLADKIPGGATVEHRWEGDSMFFTVGAMGQTVACRLDVADSHVHVEVALPGMLALFAGKVRDLLVTQGPRLLA